MTNLQKAIEHVKHITEHRADNDGVCLSVRTLKILAAAAEAHAAADGSWIKQLFAARAQTERMLAAIRELYDGIRAEQVRELEERCASGKVSE